MKNKNISIRAFVSLLLTFGFIMLTVSGICLYVAPQGRVAEAIGWRMIGLTKPQWKLIHSVFAVPFLVLGTVHLLVYNWKAFSGYLKPKATRILAMRPELLYSLVVTVVLLVGAVLIVPPFSLLSDLQDEIRLQYRDQLGVEEEDNDITGRGRGEGQRASGRGAGRGRR